MCFAGAGTVDQDGVTLRGDEAAASKIIDQLLVDWCAFDDADLRRRLRTWWRSADDEYRTAKVSVFRLADSGKRMLAGYRRHDEASVGEADNGGAVGAEAGGDA